MKAKTVVLMILLPFLVLMVASAVPVRASYTGTFHFKAWIDDLDDLYIQQGGGVVWYDHLSGDLPGYWGQLSALPTTIDGSDWYPVWTNPGNHYTAQTSDQYISGSPHPPGEWSITGITEISGRTTPAITTTQDPSSSNSYTAVLELSDQGFGGATWIEFELSWSAPILFVVPFVPLGTIVALAGCFLGIGAFRIAKRNARTQQAAHLRTTWPNTP